MDVECCENTELAVEALDTLEMVDVDGGREPPAHDSGEGDQPAGTGDGGLENCDTVEAVELGREGSGCGVVGAGVAIPITALIGCASPCAGPCSVGRIGCCANMVSGLVPIAAAAASILSKFTGEVWKTAWLASRTR